MNYEAELFDAVGKLPDLFPSQPPASMIVLL